MENGILIHEAVFSNILSEKAKVLAKPLFPHRCVSHSGIMEIFPHPSAKFLGNSPSLPAEIG
jgi:hypothetical protein